MVQIRIECMKIVMQLNPEIKDLETLKKLCEEFEQWVCS
jgi:hypothetical protein